jgi:hypothetical protein
MAWSGSVSRLTDCTDMCEKAPVKKMPATVTPKKTTPQRATKNTPAEKIVYPGEVSLNLRLGSPKSNPPGRVRVAEYLQRSARYSTLQERNRGCREIGSLCF